MLCSLIVVGVKARCQFFFLSRVAFMWMFLLEKCFNSISLTVLLFSRASLADPALLATEEMKAQLDQKWVQQDTHTHMDYWQAYICLKAMKTYSISFLRIVIGSYLNTISLPKWEQFWSFYMRDFCICVFVWALLTFFKWVGLSWKKVMSQTFVYQSGFSSWGVAWPLSNRIKLQPHSPDEADWQFFFKTAIGELYS